MPDVNVQFADDTQKVVIAAFGSEQDADAFPNQGVVKDTDKRYTAFLAKVDTTPSVASVIATRRYQAESAGMTINGMTVATDDRSQSLITGAALAASLDDTYSCNWKTEAGFVKLDAKTLLVIAKSVRAHVQACFDREAELLAAVKDGSYTDAMLEQGWP